jgi:hypothetical protein
VFWRAATRDMNGLVPQPTIDKAYEVDPAKAAAEFGAEFRTDVSAFLPREIVESAVDADVVVRPPVENIRYVMFADPSGGQHDAFTAAVCHAEGDVQILDALYERRAPFNLSNAIAEIADLARSYKISEVTGDRYAAQFVVDGFRKVGITYRHSADDRSGLYLNVLGAFTSGRVRLLDNKRLVGQFAALDRRTSATGRDRVDHPATGADDLCNAAAGGLTLAAAGLHNEIVIAGPIIGDRHTSMSHAEWTQFHGNNPFPPPAHIDFTNRR